jgi:hypothetical protein
MSTANTNVAKAVHTLGMCPQAAATDVPNTHATAVMTKKPGRVICTNMRHGKVF